MASRYTFFFVLYPLGAGSEWILMYRSLDAAKAMNLYFHYALLAILVMYVPGFYVLYSHMIKQRSKFLGAGPSNDHKSSSKSAKKKSTKKAE